MWDSFLLYSAAPWEHLLVSFPVIEGYLHGPGLLEFSPKVLHDHRWCHRAFPYQHFEGHVPPQRLASMSRCAEPGTGHVHQRPHHRLPPIAGAVEKSKHSNSWQEYMTERKFLKTWANENWAWFAGSFLSLSFLISCTAFWSTDTAVLTTCPTRAASISASSKVNRVANGPMPSCCTPACACLKKLRKRCKSFSKKLNWRRISSCS